MKSGPTLAAAGRCPAARRPARRPVAAVVLPTPEWVPATTIRGPSVGTKSTLAARRRPSGVRRGHESGKSVRVRRGPATVTGERASRYATGPSGLGRQRGAAIPEPGDRPWPSWADRPLHEDGGHRMAAITAVPDG